jgi:phosphatidylglycerophosphatase A
MTKMFYIKKIEKLPQHFGVMADDIAAGLSVNLILQILRRF